MATARSSSGAGSSATALGTNFSGDLIRLVLVNFSSATVPSVPTGYTSVRSAQDYTNGFAYRVCEKVSTGSESMPSLTSVTHLGYVVYSGIDATNQFSSPGGQSGSGTSASYSGVVTWPGPTAWAMTEYIGKNASGVPTAPTSMTLVTSDTSGGYIAIWDSNGALSSYSFNSKAISATSAWLTGTYALNTGTSGGGGGGGITVNSRLMLMGIGG